MYMYTDLTIADGCSWDFFTANGTEFTMKCQLLLRNGRPEMGLPGAWSPY